MKAGALIKIIIWSIISLFLVTLFTCLIIFENFADHFHFPFLSNESDAVSVRKTNLDASVINNIYMDWTSGSVYIEKYDGDKIIIDERSNRKLDKSELLDIKVDDGTLTIAQKHRNIFNIFGFGFKTLVRYIKVPDKEFNNLNIKFTSGKLIIDDVKSKTLSIRMTSGSIKGYDINANNLKINMTSGSLNLLGSFNDINAQATSGSLNLESSIVPSSLNVNITSGISTVTIPDNDGFILGINKTSGIFKTDFDLDDFNRYKNGDNEYNIRMTSGIVRLLKK